MSVRTRIAVLLLTVAGFGCGGDAGMAPSAAPVPVGLVLSQLAAQRGDTVAVSLAVPEDVGAVLASLRFDAGEWQYLGQLPTPYLALIETAGAAEGRLHLSAAEPRGLPSRAIELQFVAQRDAAARFTLQLHEVVSRDMRILPAGSVRIAAPQVEARRGTGTARRLAPADWLEMLGERRDVLLRPGDGRIFGDVNQNGTVTSGDLVVIANVAVGNLELLRTDRDLPIAGNVAPTNLPGLGEATDPVPPGENFDGTRTITSADQLLVANFIVGNPAPIVGQPIPGRIRDPGVLPRIILTDDTLRANRTFTADTIYEVRGTLVVGDVPARPMSQPNVTLTIAAGTRVEFEPATRGRLVVATGAKLVAVGTRLEPIVMACTGGNAFPGCWGGVHLNGFALLNNSEQIGSPLKTGRGGTGTYGGVVQADSSGALRYVRIEHAGRMAADGAILGGLQLLGVGSRTLVEYVQVHQSLGDGVFVSGGTVRLRYLFLSDNRGNALAWNDGWTGRMQFGIMQQGPGSGDAMNGSSGLLDPRSGPRSAPLLSHVTVVGPPSQTPGVRTLRLANGSGGLVLNLLAQRQGGTGIDFDGDATCEFLAAYPDSTGVAAAIIAAHDTPFAVDTDDCVDEDAYGRAAVRRNRTDDPQLLNPFVTLSPDLRPAATSPAATGDSVPPADGFFSLQARYIGAVPPATFARNGIPWYAGWTTGF